MQFRVLQICSRSGPFQDVAVHSESSDEIYSVLITDPRTATEAACTCRAFRYSKDGTCKHQEIAIQSQCNWNSESDTRQSLMERIGMTCPECGSDTEWIMKYDRD